MSTDARIESITASNAIEGINVEAKRAEAIADGRVTFRNRTEMEFAGYRDAIDGLIRRGPEPITVPLMLGLHRTLFTHVDGRGGYFKSEPNQIVSRESGRAEVVYDPPPPEATEFLMQELAARYSAAQKNEVAHPILLVAALALDFLAIHPFADGNGRTARLITNSELLVQGYGVVRYVSLEQRVFDSKHSYYAALYKSQRSWVETEGGHDIWPWAEYFVGLLAMAYEDYGTRVAAASVVDGLSKQEQVEVWVRDSAPAEFMLVEAERALPGISRSSIVLVLNRLKDEGEVSVGRGRSAKWTKLKA